MSGTDKTKHSHFQKSSKKEILLPENPYFQKLGEFHGQWECYNKESKEIRESIDFLGSYCFLYDGLKEFMQHINAA